jgi:hypothetical protein
MWDDDDFDLSDWIHDPLSMFRPKPTLTELLEDIRPEDLPNEPEPGLNAPRPSGLFDPEYFRNF